MVHRASQIRICESDATKGGAPQGFPRGVIPVLAEEKSRLWTQVRMTPTVQYDSRDIAFRVEARRAEHYRELLADSPLVIAKGSRQHFATSPMSLVFGGHPRIGI